MRVAPFVIAAAILASLSGTVRAQTTVSQTPPVASPATVTPFDPAQDHWIASAFVGSSFGSSRTANTFDTTDITTSVNFGGQVGYLWKGMVGAEILADFSPSFEMNSILLESKPHLYTYMANGMAAVPIGTSTSFSPYVSGGIGAVQMTSTFFAFDANDPANAIGTVNGNETRFGGNVGGGMMGFAGRVGFRGDVRYYKASVDNNPTASTVEGQATQALLSGLSFWRANIGVAFRW